MNNEKVVYNLLGDLKKSSDELERKETDAIKDSMKSKNTLYQDHRGVVYSKEPNGTIYKLGIMVEGQILPLGRMTKKARRRIREIQKGDIVLSKKD
jgi:hypothetical protein